MTDVKTLLGADAAAARDRISCRAAMDVLRDAFADLAAGAAVQPAQTLLLYPEGMGDCILYSGMVGRVDLMGVKLSPYLPGLSAQGENPVKAFTLLLSASTGEPRLLCDSLALTVARTAATTGLAVELLCDVASGPLCVIGAGALALEHLRFATATGAWPELRIYSPSLSDATNEHHDARRSAVEALGLDVQFAQTAEAAVADCAVVMLCTSSASPVIDLAWLAPDVLVTSIATNAPRAHEIDPGSLNDLQIYCDYRATAASTAGEFLIGSEMQTFGPEDIRADLPELVSGQKESSLTGQRYFRSTGLGIEDIAIAGLLT